MSRIKKEPSIVPTVVDLDPAVGTTNGQPSVYSEARNARSVAPTPSERRFDEPPLVLQINDTRMAGVQQTNASQSEAISSMNGSFGGIAKKLQYLNDTLGNLHSLGIQHDIQLPELVLVGDQSAGKSSLMSGLAGINLPRSGGMCTKCVTHIRVSRHQTWSCRVSLRRKYGYYPPEDGMIDAADVTFADKFHPWKSGHEKVLDFKTLDHPNEIEDVLKWAQIAILNPSKPHEHYIPGSGHATMGEHAFERAAESTEAKFSPNVISLEIKHPDFPDLSFYDLPGVFVRPPRPDENYLVNVVRNLAEEYINHREAIIIWAVAMNVDPMTSTMSKIIEDAGALNRTIGVITKADLLPLDEGTRRQWCAILGGDAHTTGHGYYVTSRRPDEKSLDDQHRWEDFFFDSPEKWPADFARFRGRCGLKQLQHDLSDKLGEAFGNCLPNVEQKIRGKLSNAKDQLRALPELPSNVELEVKDSLRSFVDLVVTKLHGSEFSSSYQRLGEQFRDCLGAMKPKVNVHDSADLIVEISDDDDDGDVTPVGTPKRRANMLPPATPSKRARTGLALVKREDSVSRAGSPLAQRARSTAGPDLGPFAQYGPPPSRKLRDIRDTIARHSRAGQPGLVDGEVHQELCRQAVAPWLGPLIAFQQVVMREVTGIISAALNEAFSQLKKRLVYERARAALQELLQKQAATTETFLRKMHAIHTRQLFTLNNSELERYRVMEEEELHRHRHMLRWQAFTDSLGAEVTRIDQLSEREKEAENKQRASQLEKMGPDSFQAEVQVYAYVRGYYRLASSRMTDTAALILYQDMIPEIEKALSREAYLERQLDVFSGREGVFQTLMSEDEATARQRDEVRADIRKYERALESISQLKARSQLEVAAGGSGGSGGSNGGGGGNGGGGENANGNGNGNGHDSDYTVV